MARDLLSVEPLGTHGLARIWRVDVCIVRRICQDVVAGFGGEDATCHGLCQGGRYADIAPAVFVGAPECSAYVV